ncbi:hypothetical protein CC80DRAFT_590191 [Byssothecium circinans]|uniref:2EXR domain-containing protein n=1 Tax=Byssothecium circinans TaxID=147558 RepID=A0A6A5UAK7_9PLEO|nr:hypothetical protein CC80DRAFT_590191 [Byssothecium circinans]
MATRSVSRPPWLEHNTPKAKESSGESTSDSSTDFEFLNDSFTRPSRRQASFHPFQDLPPTLRWRIWNFSLPQKRLLKVTVAAEPACSSPHRSRDDVFKKPNLAPYQAKNDLGNIVSGADYHLRLRSASSNSSLLYVNHESNAVIHDVYRVHVPINQHILISDAPCLRFCPERDTILITVERDEDKAYFADFVHDALAYDPKKKGILHIAIMSQGIAWNIHLPIGISNLHGRAQAALACTLGRLESVSLVHLFRTKSRQMFSSLQKHSLSNLIPQTELVRFNRAYPLWSSAASYLILPGDPRPVSRYLDLVDCGWDPRGLIRAWRMFEAAYDVLPTSPDKIRVLIAAADSDERLEITTASQARVLNPDDDESLEFAKTQNAIGFWSIPLEAFGNVPEVPYTTHRWPMTQVRDLTQFDSQIQLGLFEVA